MSANSTIEWTDHTFNPWIGCMKVSPGCDHCYAEKSTPARVQGIAWGPTAERRRTSTSNWALPIRWNAAHAAFSANHGRRQRVFCASLADVFDNAVDPAWRGDLFKLIDATPNLDWLLLTKRIGNARDMIADARGLQGFQWYGQPNVWLGATVTCQQEANRDVPKLLGTPAAIRFLSMEPLLGPVDLSRVVEDTDHSAYVHDSLSGFRATMGGGSDTAAVDWVIVGGESGPHARPTHPEWVESLRDQCINATVPFFFKQWGEWAPSEVIKDEKPPSMPQQCGDRWTFVSGQLMRRVGKKAAGRLLDGQMYDAFPGGGSL